MTKWLLALGGALAMLAAPPAHSRQNVGSLLSDCAGAVAAMDQQSAPRDGLSAGYCLGYLEGIADDVRVGKVSDSNIVICIPSEVTPGQLARVFVKHARETPETHHEDQLLGVLSAFATAFRCSNPE